MAKLTLQAFKSDTLAAQLTAAATSATLTSGNFGTPSGKQYLVIDPTNSKREVISATITGTALTNVVRALDGTSDVTHSADAEVIMAFVPSHYALLANATNDGWVDESLNETWVYASASSFTVAGVDVTAKYTKGTKLKWTDSGGTKYGHVKSSSFSTNTTVNIVVNTDYVIANSTISANYYSYANNPQGFPLTFTWTPSLTNVTLGNGTVTGEYSINSGTVWISLLFSFGTTSSISGSVSTSTPTDIEDSVFASTHVVGALRIRDTGVATYWGLVSTNGSDTSLDFQVANTASTYSTATNLSSTVPMTWANGDSLGLTATYPMG